MTLPKHIDLSLIVRGIAASLVVWWHSVGYKGEIITFINIPGRVSVWLFFIISGYVIAYGFVNNRYTFTFSDISRFYKARLLRIVPLFWLVSICSLITAYMFDIKIEPLNIAAEFFVIQWSHSYTLSGVFWTLGIELQFYLIAPLLVWILIRYKNDLRYSLIIFALFLTWPILAKLFFAVDIDNRTTVGNMSHFFIGMIAAVSFANLQINKRHVYGAIVTGVVGIMIAAHLYHVNGRLFYSGLGALLVDSAGLLILIAHCTVEKSPANPKNYILSSAFGVGILSYGLYAWHAYLLRYFPTIFDHVLLLFGASLLLAYLSYILIELPALSLKRRSLASKVNE